MKSTRLLLAAMLLAATLTACSRDEPERPPTNTVEETGDAPATPTHTPTPQASRIAAPDAGVQSNAMDELTDEPVVPDERMMDDAAASGMTARARRDEPAQDAPSDVVEQK